MSRSERKSLTLPPATDKAIDRLANERGISEAAVMKYLIERGLRIEAIVARGGKILAREPDGQEYLLEDRDYRQW